jgi:AraC-like DNA-binding protein
VGGIGRIYLWLGGSLWIGHSAGLSGVHAHHAFQISLPRDAPVGFRAALAAPWQDYDGAIVKPHQPHQFDGRGGRVAQLFVEPETAEGRVLFDLTDERPITPLTRGQVRPLIEALYGRFDRTRDEAPMIEAARRALRQLVCCAPRPSALDPRIARAQTFLRAQIERAPTLAETAAQVHLSPGRLRHLFVAQTGTSYRAYLLWLRLLEAVRAFNVGASWTDAAHTAGFADSAHLSRTFKRMFGFSPVRIVKE